MEVSSARLAYNSWSNVLLIVINNDPSITIITYLHALINKWACNTGEMIVVGENRSIQMKHLSNYPSNHHESHMKWPGIEYRLEVVKQHTESSQGLD